MATVTRDGSAVAGSQVSVSGARTTSNKTIAANSNRALYFFLDLAAASPPTVSNVNWNTSEAMAQVGTFINSGGSGNHRIYVYRLLNPTATTANISFTLSATADEVGYVIDSLYNVHQTTPEGTFRTNFATGAPANAPDFAIGLSAGQSGGLAYGFGAFDPNTGAATLASRTAVPYYVSVGTATSSAGATGLTPTGAPAGRLLGDIELCSVATENNNTISVSGSGWAQLGSTVTQDATWQQAIFARRYDGSNVDPAFTWTGSVGCSARRWLYRDLTGSSTFTGGHTSNSGNTSTHSITGINATANNSSVMYLSHAEANTALGADAGYTERFDAGSATGPYRLVVGDRTEATSGAGADNFSATGASASWVMRLLELMAGTAQTHVAEAEDIGPGVTAVALASEASDTNYNSIGFTVAGTVANCVTVGFHVNPSADSVLVDVTRNNLYITGRSVTEQLIVPVTPANLRITGRNVGISIVTQVPVTPANLRISGRDVSFAIIAPVTRTNLIINGRDVGVAIVGGAITVDVTPANLRVTGRNVDLAIVVNARPAHMYITGATWTAEVIVDSQPAHLQITGHEVGVAIIANVVVPVERGHINVVGRDVSVAIVVPVTRANLFVAGRNVGVQVVTYVNVDPAALRITGHSLSTTLVVNADPAHLLITGRDVQLAIVSSTITVDVVRAHLLINGRDVDIQIVAPTPPAPGGGFDPVSMGRRSYANLRFEPPRRGLPEQPKKREAHYEPETAPNAPPSKLGTGIPRLLQALIRRAELPPPPPPPPVGEVAVERARVREAGKSAEQPKSPAQAQAGNYPKGHVRLLGFDISIESPAGSIRQGPKWSTLMQNAYGYIRGTEGADESQIDVYLGENLTEDNPVFVIDQYDLTGKFDEHKAVLGARDADEAESIYDRHFTDGSGPRRRGVTVRMALAQFKRWLAGEDDETLEPAEETKPAPTPEELADADRERRDAEVQAWVEMLDSQVADARSEVETERELRERAQAEVDRMRESLRRSRNRLAIEIAIRRLLGGE